MSDTPASEIIGVFHDRSAVEGAIEMLQSHGLDRSQLAILGTADAIWSRLGLEVARPASGQETIGHTPIDESEKQNVTPLIAGLPAYVTAALAAGVAVASGGTLAGAVVAALLGGVGGGAIGAGAASLFRGSVDDTYAEQLAHGGMLLLVHPRDQDDLRRAREILDAHADRTVETALDRTTAA